MEIKIQTASSAQRRPKPVDESTLGFGKIFADHMFTMRWEAERGWHAARIQPYADLALSPAALVLHYGQTIFEGLKAYRTPQGGVNLFRPQLNMERLSRSARRLDLPQVDGAFVLGAIESLVALDYGWVPQSQGASLYIRPTLIATEPYIGLKSTAQALFFIITGPVGAYYPQGFSPVRITVCRDFSRAGPGGLGAAKTAANYAASLLAEKQATQAGYDQVLWLDAAERRYVEEVGSMNILFKIGGKIITSPLSDTILGGVTRDSAIQLLRSWGEEVEERRLAIDEIIQAQQEGRLEEVFGAGTAAVISPVGVLEYAGKPYTIAEGRAGPLANRLYESLTTIQYGRAADPFGWVHAVPMELPQAAPLAAQAATA